MQGLLKDFAATPLNEKWSKMIEMEQDIYII